MLRSLVFLLACLFLIPSMLMAQRNGTLTGRVIDATGNPIHGATVEILKTSPRLGSYARRDGRYNVARLEPGTYRVAVYGLPHMKSDTIRVTVRPGKTTVRDITLRPVPPPKAVTRKSSTDIARLTPSKRKSDVRKKEAKPGEKTSSDAVTITSTGTRTTSIDDMDRSARTTISEAMPFSGGFGATGTGDATVTSGVSIRGGRASETSIRVDGVEAGDAFALSPASAESGAPKTAAAKGGAKVRLAEDVAPSEPVRKQPGQLTAGEWSDLDNWSYWVDIISDANWTRMLRHWGYDPASRVTVRLVDGSRPVIDAEVRLVDGQGMVIWTARSDNRGRAELFTGINNVAGEYAIEVMKGGDYVSAGTVRAGNPAPYLVRLPGAASRRDEFDLMFVVDATGSMGDEMSYITSELESVIDRNREASNDDLRLRLSCNFYRDRGDEYLVRPFPFSESTFEMIGNLRHQQAGGGGDTPEAVEEALADAIEGHDWSPRARARLLFLVLDAPPHYTPEILARLRDLTARAAAKGIRIIPLASSGIDKETEFLLRFFSIYTGGTYTFLTDDSGIGHSHMKPTVGPYRVEYLNDLMVRVIARYLAVDDLAPEEVAEMDLR